MWCEELLARYLTGMAYDIVLEHGRAVAALAEELAVNAGLDEVERKFVMEAAILHDIGVGQVNAPQIGCFGDKPYIVHGVIGRAILEHEGLPRHALVCERHIGVGLTIEDIVVQQLPLPLRDMSPITLAERIICCSDLFYSKKQGKLWDRKSVTRVRTSLSRFGVSKVVLFNEWCQEFGFTLK